MNNNIIKNVANLLTYQFIATKKYVVRHAADGGAVFGDIKLSIGFDLVRSPDVMILLQVRSLHFCWGRTQIC